MQYSLPHFGELSLEQLEEYYNVETAAGVSLDLNFEHTRIDIERADLLKSWLEDLDYFQQQNKVAIQHDFKTGEGEVQSYIRFYIEELDEEQLADIVGDAESDEEKSAVLLDKLRLKRLGFYPDGKYGTPNFAIFDYTIDIDGEPCNQLLVINWNDQREIVEITWES
ncbi:DUF2004 domain-containing protein [Chitinophaga sp. G-6-1-13]|uniref:DUF2004 domain-containing protein n=1 Tax=Chitinophaga fulva TaxID=2728842 RepID=A0A848GN75_9BACT|nr:DUF2004 domain-containing protein [Chitinophaga fulva]NML38120.1 DUF2004 domain-containing protein [Chitinophaga fulva]